MLGQLVAVVGIIDRSRAVGAEVGDLVPLLAQPGGEQRLAARKRHGRRRWRSSCGAHRDLVPEVPPQKRFVPGEVSYRLLVIKLGRDHGLPLSRPQRAARLAAVPGHDDVRRRQPRKPSPSGSSTRRAGRGSISSTPPTSTMAAPARKWSAAASPAIAITGLSRPSSAIAWARSPTRAGSRASGSSRTSTTVCAGSAPTSSTSSISTSPTAMRRSTNRCARSRT